jgi:sulfite reductase (NADPH) hemoprotein beta-component
MVKAVKTPDAQIVTANRLRDGAVVYLGADSRWSTMIADSAVARDAAAAASLMATAERAVADRVVVGPYLIEVAVTGGLPQPLGTRERIRAFGPSIAAGVAEPSLA